MKPEVEIRRSWRQRTCPWWVSMWLECDISVYRPLFWGQTTTSGFSKPKVLIFDVGDLLHSSNTVHERPSYVTGAKTVKNSDQHAFSAKPEIEIWRKWQKWICTYRLPIRLPAHYRVYLNVAPCRICRV